MQMVAQMADAKVVSKGLCWVALMVDYLAVQLAPKSAGHWVDHLAAPMGDKMVD